MHIQDPDRRFQLS